jgi:hemerythrin
MSRKFLVVWKKEFSVHNEALDAEHLAMFGLINELFETLDQGEPQRTIEEILDEAQRYAQQHFEHEESLMAQCGFPKLEEHRQEHRMYLVTVGLLQKDLTLSAEDKVYELFLFLQDWWLTHITKADQDYAKHLDTGLGSLSKR